MAERDNQKINRYRKDKKVTLYQKKPDDGFEPGESEEDVATNIWAYYRHASANEVSLAEVAGYEIEAVFRINWRDDLNYDMKVKFRGDKYEITRIDDFEGYKNDITIHAKKID